MEKELIEAMRKMSKEMDKVMNGSQEQKTEDRQQIFNAGYQMGIQYMMDKIERQYQLGKPILANDNLYWLKGAKENLRDIMDDIEAEYNAEMKKNE